MPYQTYKFKNLHTTVLAILKEQQTVTAESLVAALQPSAPRVVADPVCVKVEGGTEYEGFPSTE